MLYVQTVEPLGKPRLAESVFKLQFSDNIQKELYMKAEKNLLAMFENTFVCLCSPRELIAAYSQEP